MCEPICASGRPGDSVINPNFRGRSGVLIGSSIGATSLLHSVPLATQTNDDVFVDYGPFINEADSVMTVTLTSRGNGRRTLIAGIGSSARYVSEDSITLNVLPGELFGFSIKGYAEITASIAHAQSRIGSTGIPSATDFASPKGIYVGCLDYGLLEIGETTVRSDVYYLYEVNSMSDKSIRRDQINAGNPKVTTGIKPADPGVCRAS